MPYTNNKEFKNLKKDVFVSKRATSPALEEILFEPLKVLDHGFIRVVDYMGNDTAVTQAARVSYGKGTKTLQNDKALINYLMRHNHTSPFEMCEIKFHIKAPIFIARQWVRHRTANINEYSGRYSLMSNEFYVPKKEQIKKQSTTNKQGREDTLSEISSTKATDYISDISKQSFQVYEYLLNLDSENDNQGTTDMSCKDGTSFKSGLTRELSRIILPLNTYTEFYWKIDLHNLLHFLLLRSRPNAQYEIRVYAQTILDIVQKWVPIIYNAFINYKYNSVTLSQEGYKVISDIINSSKVNKQDYSLSKREWSELEELFDLKNKVE